MKDILVFCFDETAYKDCLRTLIPQLEHTHKIKFEHVLNTYYSTKFRITPLLDPSDFSGKNDFDIVFYKNWEENKHLAKIMKIYKNSKRIHKETIIK
ncbi:MAG: hypothetical protein KDD61_09170 [Bdellovibrionales bacterium]|nr:hypothetical protein [Bdellovibrionales bacterium]